MLGLPAPDASRLSPLAAEAVAAAGTPDCVLRVVWTGGREHEQQGVGFALVTPLPDGLEEQRARGIALAGLQLVVASADQAHTELSRRGVEVSDVQDFPWGRFVFFADPDGNRWSAQEIQARA